MTYCDNQIEEKEDTTMKLEDDHMSLNEELSLVNKPSKQFGCGICDEEFQIIEIISKWYY